MKRALLALGLVAIGVSAFGQKGVGAPKDVPRDHWAFKAVDDLFKAGLLDGYPDGTFKGTRPVTRYELSALENLRAIQLPTIPQGGAPGSSLLDLQRQLDALKVQLGEVQENRSQLDGIRTKLSSQREELARLRGDLEQMRRDVTGIGH